MSESIVSATPSDVQASEASRPRHLRLVWPEPVESPDWDSVPDELPANDAPTARAVVHVTARVDEVADAAIHALRSAGGIYQRAGKLVRAVHIESAGAPPTPAIVELAHPTLREMVARAADWQRWDRSAKGWRPCSPDDQVVAAVLARVEYPGIPPIVGIAETPLLRPDGSIMQAPGFDAATGYLYEPAAVFPAVPEHPTQDDAKRALAELVEVFADFPYRSPADQMVAVAAILTLIGRPAIAGCTPIFAFEANTRGAGKGKQVQAISRIATGRDPGLSTFPHYEMFNTETVHVREDELGKMLDALALKSASLVVFDNVAGPFGGAPLDKQVTSMTAEPRVLGKSEAPRVPWRGIFFATGNNLQIVGDTQRRTLVSRLDAQEDPERRSDFAHPDLMGWVSAERARLVTSALTVLRAYIVAGQPRLCGTMSSFEEWSALIPGAIVYAGGADPLLCRIDERGSALDPKLEALKVLLASWGAMSPGGAPITAAQMIQCVAEDASGDLDEVAGALAVLVGWKRGADALQAATKLGRVLGAYCGRWLSGLRLEKRGQTRNKSQLWGVVQS